MLDDKIYEKIQNLCEIGDELAEGEQYGKAIDKYTKALKLIPEPKYIYEASTWVYTAIGDSFYLAEDFENALDNFNQALKCEGGLGNPFIVLRIGECFYELDNIERAKYFLLQAYMIEGEDVFSEEDEKYFKLIGDMI